MKEDKEDVARRGERALIRVAGELPDGTASVEMFVVQQWSRLNSLWMDGPSEAYETEAEALEREEEISGWSHVDRTRVVCRVVHVSERVVTREK